MRLASASSADASYPQLIGMAACLVLAFGVHASTVPLWISGVVLASLSVRLLLAARGYAAPARPVRLAVAGAAMLVLFLQLRTFNGLTAGGTLLSLVAGLKFLETQTRRDLFVVALIIYFLSLAALLRSESFWLLGYVVGVSWLTAAALLRLSHITPPQTGSTATSLLGPTAAAPTQTWPRALRYAARICVQALPLALVFWLFFPRFDGPLWHLPNDERSATTGLGDSMSPADIAQLALSDEIAFRVHFEGAVPPASERYWRGPVLHDFDGRSWRGSMSAATAPPPLAPQGSAYRYRLSLEPHRFDWLFVLDWPDRWSLGDAHLTADYTLVLGRPVSQPIEVTATSHTRVETAASLAAADRQRDTWLPPGRNPRSTALAAELHRVHSDDAGFVQAVLEMFHDQRFYYTLEPPPLGRDAVDEFLFDTKRGFCGHYASAFAVLARAAGIPARVVTGYQGGLYNRHADYYLIYQKDAHAWDEIWLDGRGWIRVDPTSVISLARIDSSLQDAFAAERGGGGLHLDWLADWRLRLDALGELWRERVLRFDEASQRSILERFGIEQPDGRKIVTVMGAGIVLAFAWLMWQVRREARPEQRDPLVRTYGRLCARLAAAGLPRRAHEGAEGYAARIARERPRLAEPLSALAQQYSQLRYGANPPESATAALAAYVAAVRAFRPKRQAG